MSISEKLDSVLSPSFIQPSRLFPGRHADSYIFPVISLFGKTLVHTDGAHQYREISFLFLVLGYAARDLRGRRKSPRGKYPSWEQTIHITDRNQAQIACKLVASCWNVSDIDTIGTIRGPTDCRGILGDEASAALGTGPRGDFAGAPDRPRQTAFMAISALRAGSVGSQ
jgi:hypothetical protein